MTGCRLSEVRGLRVEDVTTEGETPHISVAWHDERRVKAESSFRCVPLVGDALEAAREAVAASEGDKFLFVRYLGKNGADNISSLLMGHVRKETANPKHVVHSLRHNMKDWLREAEVSKQDQDLILGHASSDVGDRVYGGNVARLRAATRAMKKALAVDQ